MAVNEILDEIENLVVDARRVVFTNKCIIEEDDLIRLVDDLRNALPNEIQNAGQVMQERQQILDEAKREANKIVEQAKNYGEKLVAEHEIVKQAQNQASEIMEKTIQNSNELKEDSVKYANQVFDHLLSGMNSTLDVVQQAKADLNQGSK
ncbi:hypothetical protein SAMN05660742_10372 [Propionispira arboris]|uniref:ATPase n=1 Tax=Propionispira arboris TaxID=84035 RepID=A0A1H6W490_9FIRM|nr:ATPase [Propionispira arboris]SEJ07650.1 hypothetical protein SAMN05660742_10372 [Propionispira arboris]